MTIAMEMTKGERPVVTNSVGASAEPSQAPAVTPETTPITCRFRGVVAEDCEELMTTSSYCNENQNTDHQGSKGYPELNVCEYGPQE